MDDFPPLHYALGTRNGRGQHIRNKTKINNHGASQSQGLSQIASLINSSNDLEGENSHGPEQAMGSEFNPEDSRNPELPDWADFKMTGTSISVDRKEEIKPSSQNCKRKKKLKFSSFMETGFEESGSKERYSKGGYLKKDSPYEHETRRPYKCEISANKDDDHQFDLHQRYLVSDEVTFGTVGDLDIFGSKENHSKSLSHQDYKGYGNNPPSEDLGHPCSGGHSKTHRDGQKTTQRKGKKSKPTMRPAPLDMLGFKQGKHSKSSKPYPHRERKFEIPIVPEIKPRRRKAKEKRTLIVPTIQQDSDTSNDEGDEKSYVWLHNEPADRVLDHNVLRSLQEQFPTVIGLTLARCSDSLEQLLRIDDSSVEDDLLLVSVISRACSCNVIHLSASQIISCLERSNFFKEKIRKLSIKVRDEVETIDDFALQSFFSDMIKLLHAQKVSATGADPTILSRLLMMGLARQLTEYLGIYHSRIVHELEDLKESKAEASQAAVLSQEYDFRKIPIMPGNSDIDPNLKPDLKKNKESGSYMNVDEYLDVQFRLLREDFIQPLRQGISEYQDLMNKKDRRALRLYQNVKIRRILCSESGIVYRLQFDVGKLRHVDWRNTKRLMYGSMVCISTDKFITVRFATVCDRKPEKLEQGKVDIRFEGKIKLDPRTVFVMVETPALFEAYRHILVGLQNIETRTFPFKQYFVDTETTVTTPGYLESGNTNYDLSCLMTSGPVKKHFPLDYDDSSSDESDGEANLHIDVLSLSSLTSPENLYMDDSQWRAFQTALTKELAIIQGPPGTGKTYVGLKIMKALLNNRHAWNPLACKPLLVVCYTNHALDQFLEGIISFFKGNVLRVGGRSKSERLVHHNINRRRTDLYRNKWKQDEEIREILEIRQKLRDDFVTYQREIEEYGQQIDATTTGIMHENQLQPFMKDHYNKLKKSAKGAPSALLEWLGVTGIGKTKGKGKSEKEEQTVQMDEEDDEEEDDTSKERKIDDIDEFLMIQTKKLSWLRNNCLAFCLSDCDMTDKDWNQKHTEKLKKDSRQTLKTRVRKEILEITRMDDSEAANVKDVLSLAPAERWKLYRFWVDKFCEKLHHLMEPLKTECQNAADRFKEANGLVDKYIFEHSDVIGMTTTGAARYHSVLSAIQPPVIIVEEAAEVLEGHIVTSLSPGCKHLILIGDHQQLRPSPNVYELSKRYNLDLSLFERMINNGLHCDTLELQHRMRPEISRVMKHIYKNLKDHESVLAYDNVKGVTENIFFINHSVPESENVELLSHLNEFEAQYMSQLCRYLLKQGYRPKQITVLSTYSAQVSRLRSLMIEESQNGVIITAVDNYQGEENDIILLSLVRSNVENRIGFLKTDNRICVALSRARKGLYVIGNFDLLSSKSQTWSNIVQDLKASNQFGPGLELYCQTHPADKKIITDPKMFSCVPDGGCMKECEYILNCGHVCQRKCHSYDKSHQEYFCMQPCEKLICKLGHQCPGKCSEECDPCQIPIEQTLPCGHTQMIPCSADPAEHECLDICDEILSCGHKCGNICGREHICYENVEKQWPCGHASEVLCLDKDTAQCQSPCNAKLKCGHQCQGSCLTCYDGRLHEPCKLPCNKTLICGHECGGSCSQCPPCAAACEKKCPHQKCKKDCGQRCKPCLEPCQWKCSHYKCTKTCEEPCDRPRCDKRCRIALKCKHTCIGLCGEACPPYCRKCNEKDVKPFLPETEDIAEARFIFLNDCSHIVEVKALDHIFDLLQQKGTISFPCCPWCGTSIRSNTRYNVILKKITKDIELIKMAYDERAKERIQELNMRIDDELDVLHCNADVAKLVRHARESETRLTALKTQTEFLLHVEAMETEVDDEDDVMKDLLRFKRWLLSKREVFQFQETCDAQNERLKICSTMLLNEIDHSDMVDIPVSFLKEVEDVWNILKDWEKSTPEKVARVTNLRDKWMTLNPERSVRYDGLTYEKIQVWESLSLEKGKWYNCPNAKEHVYYEDEMTEDGSCPVCEDEHDNSLHTDEDVASI